MQIKNLFKSEQPFLLLCNIYSITSICANLYCRLVVFLIKILFLVFAAKNSGSELKAI